MFFKDWGLKIIDILIAVLIVAYLSGYLWKKMLASNGVIKVLTIIEFCALSIIALGCALVSGRCRAVQGILFVAHNVV